MIPRWFMSRLNWNETGRVGEWSGPTLSCCLQLRGRRQEDDMFVVEFGWKPLFAVCVSLAHPIRRSGQEPGDVPCPPHPWDHVQVSGLSRHTCWESDVDLKVYDDPAAECVSGCQRCSGVLMKQQKTCAYLQLCINTWKCNKNGSRVRKKLLKHGEKSQVLCSRGPGWFWSASSFIAPINTSHVSPASAVGQHLMVLLVQTEERRTSWMCLQGENRK